MSIRKTSELRAIIDKQLDAPPLNASEIEQLELLLQDEQNMEYYLSSMELAAHTPDAVENAELGDLAKLRKHRQMNRRWVTIAAATAACLVFFAGWYSASSPATPITLTATPPPAKKSTNVRAVVTGMFGVRWIDKENNVLNPDIISIESGLVELTYETGVSVIIEGPAHYAVTGENRGALEFGKFVAVVPKGAEGFTVDYPTGKIVDLGTEFGVDLARNGDLSVGVFKGKVELHPKGAKQISLIEEDHALSQRGSSLNAISSIPFERDQFIRNIPSREFSWAINSKQEIEQSFDVSHLIWKPGKYRAVIKWMFGKHAVNISGATLWRDNKLISQDVHMGSSGELSRTKQNIYNLEINASDYSKAIWTLKVKFSPWLSSNSPPPVSTKGILLLEEGLAYQATRQDFIGRWQYTHNGLVWERKVNSDGTIDLLLDGELKNDFKKTRWIVENGVMKIWIPHKKLYETHILRDPNTMIFVNNPYRNAVKVKSAK